LTQRPASHRVLHSFPTRRSSDLHAGAGVQHIAFAAENIVTALDSITARGVAFLDAPGSYYTLLADRVTPVRYSIEELRQRDILRSEEHTSELQSRVDLVCRLLLE